MVRTFCKTGEKEAFKGAFHATGGVIAALMAAYNVAAWCYRRERHLGVNAIVYTLATLWEVKQTAHHFERGILQRPRERTLTLVARRRTPSTVDCTASPTERVA
ncbi:MAG: hypothetical protein ACRD2N_22100 [Vicinamibacterales bacterium]